MQWSEDHFNALFCQAAAPPVDRQLEQRHSLDKNDAKEPMITGGHTQTGDPPENERSRNVAGSMGPGPPGRQDQGQNGVKEKGNIAPKGLSRLHHRDSPMGLEGEGYPDRYQCR